jgi:hypothetical protein
MMRPAGHAARAALGIALGAMSLASAALPAAGQARLDRVVVSRTRIGGGGHVQAWVSVEDTDGGPLTGLERGGLSVTWDGRTPHDLAVRPVAERDPAFELTLVVDPDVARDHGSALRSLLAALGAMAGDRDRVKISFTGTEGRSIGGPLSRAADLDDKLGSLGTGRDPSHLYDALYREVRALLVVTRGVESGSQHQVPEVLALAGNYEQHVPLLVMLLDPNGTATEAERLSRIAPRSGGTFERLDGPERLPDIGAKAVRKLRSAYVLEFRDPRWDAGAERHAIEVTASAGGDQRAGGAAVITSEAMARAWWQGSLPWVVLVVVILSVLALLPLFVRKPLVRLRVVEGDERGFTYELYEVPVTLGAADGNDLIFSEQEVSRNHAVFERRGSTIELVDLNSENGTFVNGDRISRRRLSKGDRVSLGGAVEFEVRG